MRGILCAEKDVIKFSQSPKLDTEVGCSMISAKFKVTKEEEKGKKDEEDETDFLVIGTKYLLGLVTSKTEPRYLFSHFHFFPFFQFWLHT
jgi:hypothetical protein